MKTIYFVRHGESESNFGLIMSGSGDNIPLTAKGREQAKQAGQDLKDKRIELMVCSPLIRTVDTAKIIAEQIGYDPEKIVQNPILVERTYGIYDGRPAEHYKKDYAAGTVHSSVETEKQLYDRIKNALAWLSELPEDRIAVVAHGGVRRAVYVINENLHHSHMYKIDSFGNGEIYEFQL
jgi:broad specificity phosphatase PhoE